MKTKLMIWTLNAALLFLVLAAVTYSAVGCPAAGGFLSALALGAGFLGMAYQRNDESSETKITLGLPNGAATTNSTGFDLGHGLKGDFLANCELEVASPALNTTELPDAKTMIYDVFHDTASDFSGETKLFDNVITQTGAGGVGDVAATVNLRLPVDVKRYVRVKATGSAAGDATTASATLRLRF